MGIAESESNSIHNPKQKSNQIKAEKEEEITITELCKDSLRYILSMVVACFGGAEPRTEKYTV